MIYFVKIIVILDYYAIYYHYILWYICFPNLLHLFSLYITFKNFTYLDMFICAIYYHDILFGIFFSPIYYIYLVYI